MNRIDRLFGILTLLQARKFVQAETIAEKYCISIRTVYRDIKALGELNIPVSHEPLKGYFILQGYFLPPLSFTSEEANALILMTSLASRFTDRSVTRHGEAALEKIKSVLKQSENEGASQLEKQISIYVPEEETELKGNLNTIQKAIIKKTILEIEYTNNLSIKAIRRIEPIGLTFYTFQWHVIAWCWEREAYRDFKVKMITQLHDLRIPFRRLDHWDMLEYIQSLKGNAEHRPTVTQEKI
jgi:predicted DNA-binding transcriptional regulator YafY